ncbi:hypothetical protein ABR737_09775 [Streptomyces sp. Edi2]|uniref:hypothetical protein n=1 Tax=Streptomyces sp. Edi2 TaxID=3162528 RepID=UPI003306400F
MLAEDLSDYLFARSTGHFASLMALINRSCLRAIRTGAERLDEELMSRDRCRSPARPGRPIPPIPRRQPHPLRRKALA